MERAKIKRSIREIEPVLKKVRRYLKKVYQDRLVDIILYGSFARNKATIDSDIDIAIILKGEVKPAKEIDRVSNFISDTGLEYDELISVLPVSLKMVKNSIWPLYKGLQREGIRL